MALYEADQRGLTTPHIDPTWPVKTARLVRGVHEHLPQLDSAIDDVSARWRVARMPPVDRSILRLGLYELRFEPSTPMAVIVSGARDMTPQNADARSILTTFTIRSFLKRNRRRVRFRHGPGCQ